MIAASGARLRSHYEILRDDLLQCLVDFLNVSFLVQNGGHVAASGSTRRRAGLRRRRVEVVVADILLVPQVQGEVDDALLRVKVLLLKFQSGIGDIFPEILSLVFTGWSIWSRTSFC